jgi:hypothetical protein
MDSENRSVAFVAMKFDSDHWRDKRYIVIKEELDQAGFDCVRADQINTSGSVVDEVCRLLKDAKLVIIDSSGDSQSVSYEIGYCHGIGRPADTTLLLRSDANIPFNYRHFRHRVYKDLRHLRQLIRDYLKLSEPIMDEMYGYAFTFEFSEQAYIDYIYDGAACIFDALATLNFTGRAECYAGEQFSSGERLFTVGLVLRLPGRKPTPTYKWWQKVVRFVSASAAKSQGRIKLDTQLSELASKRGMKAWFPQCGGAEFVDGSVARLIGGEASVQDSSFFSTWMRSANRNSEATLVE